MAGASKVEKLPPWGNAIAGSAGAVLANALVYPLDIVKTRLQTQVKRSPTYAEAVASETDDDHHYTSTIDAMTKIVKTDGMAGLYAGMTGSLIGVASTNFAYFYWYTVVRTFYLQYSSAPGTAAELSLGAVAGAVAQVFTIPVAVVTARQQTAKKHEREGLIATGKQVKSEDGWSGLWRGLKASLVLVVNPAITYGAYQRLKEVMFPNKKTLKPWEAFVLGAMSKALATIATQPLIVAKVGLQSNSAFKTFVEVMQHIIEHEGVMGLFKGIGPQILKGLLVQGFLMMTKERIELTFILLFRYIRQVRAQQLQKLATIAAEKAQQTRPALLK